MYSTSAMRNSSIGVSGPHRLRTGVHAAAEPRVPVSRVSGRPMWTRPTDSKAASTDRHSGRTTSCNTPGPRVVKSCPLLGLPGLAPVAQGIEHRPPEAVAQVRILPGAPNAGPVLRGLQAD